jgi:hypothetical protein
MKYRWFLILCRTILECCEYDACGSPYILDTQYAPRTTSNYGNPYLFTGRKVDVLDSGYLKIQYNSTGYPNASFRV